MSQFSHLAMAMTIGLRFESMLVSHVQGQFVLPEFTLLIPLFCLGSGCASFTNKNIFLYLATRPRFGADFLHFSIGLLSSRPVKEKKHTINLINRSSNYIKNLNNNAWQKHKENISWMLYGYRSICTVLSTLPGVPKKALLFDSW